MTSVMSVASFMDKHNKANFTDHGCFWTVEGWNRMYLYFKKGLGKERGVSHCLRRNGFDYTESRRCWFRPITDSIHLLVESMADEMNASPSICESMAKVVLGETYKGRYLTPVDFKLVENAIGGLLKTAAARDALSSLYESVINGMFQFPWHFGCKHVIKDQAGKVYWKGREIELFEFLSSEKEKQATEHFARCCRAIEEDGRDVNRLNYYDYSEIIN